MFLVVLLITDTWGNPLAGSPWEVLNGFQLIHDSIAQIDAPYVAALLREPDRGLFAVVIFSANSDSVRCQVRNAAHLFVFDTQGVKLLEHTRS